MHILLFMCDLQKNEKYFAENRKIGSTKLLTNQLGYVMADEHHFFDHGCIVEI